MCCGRYLEVLLLFVSIIDSIEALEANDSECTIYLAQSSIPGAGFGLFTTRDLSEKDFTLPYSDAPNIVVCDYNEFSVPTEEWVYPDYFWSLSTWGDFECIYGSESVLTFGSLCNFHTILANVKGLPAGYNDEAANRYIHPSAGSFTYHKGHLFKATRKIMAGEELFADYGEGWLESREGTFAENVPRKDDFNKAGDILNILRENHLESAVLIDDEVLSLVKDSTEVFNERVASLVPNTKAKYEVLTEDKEKHYSNVLAESTAKKREVKWIRENGFCMENIKPGKSIIPFIGQGAFANRFLAEGSIVTPIPLLQIMNSDLMTTYDVHLVEEKGQMKVGEKPTGKQLLLNYCFGHKDSKLLLCPETNAILINHCSTRKNTKKFCEGPNAKIRWASGWDPDTPTWLEMSLSHLAETTAARTRGLSLEVIATQDIKVGEEIFIDYGPNWEDAWELHKAIWKPPAEGIKFETLNSVIKNTPLRTIDELKYDPYPDNIRTVCFWYEYIDEGYTPDERGYYRADDYISDDLQNANLWECDLLKRLNVAYYEVRIVRKREQLGDVFLTMYPQQSITFRMKPYTSDQFLPGTFRHFIEINDEIFPEQWKTSYNHTNEKL